MQKGDSSCEEMCLLCKLICYEYVHCNQAKSLWYLSTGVSVENWVVPRTRSTRSNFEVERLRWQSHAFRVMSTDEGKVMVKANSFEVIAVNDIAIDTKLGKMRPTFNTSCIS